MSKWQMVKLGEVVFFQEGPGVRNTQYTTSGVKLLNVANLQNGIIDLTTSQRYISNEEAYGKYKHFLVDEGDLIIASSGIKVDYFDKKMGFIKAEHLPLCMNTSTIRFKALNKNILDIRYFMYYLKTNNFKEQLSKQIVGSAQLNFGPSHLKKMKIPLPPLEEQRAIANELDSISQLITKRKHQLEQLDLLVKSKFVEMFGDPVTNPMGWEVKKLGEYLSVLTDFSANGSYEYLDSNVKMYNEKKYALMVRTTDLERNTFNQDVKYIDENAYKILSKSYVLAGDLIMNKIGSAGRIYLMPKLNIPVSLGRNAFLLRLSNNLNNIFCYNLLTSNYGINEISQYIRGAVTKTITKDAVRAINIIIPPIELQNEFAEFVSKVENTKCKLKKGLENFNYLYNARINEYFK